MLKWTLSPNSRPLGSMILLPRKMEAKLNRAGLSPASNLQPNFHFSTAGILSPKPFWVKYLWKSGPFRCRKFVYRSGLRESSAWTFHLWNFTVWVLEKRVLHGFTVKKWIYILNMRYPHYISNPEIWESTCPPGKGTLLMMRQLQKQNTDIAVPHCQRQTCGGNSPN